MKEDSYLIPANSKKSMLIFGFFTKIDLIIAGVGLLFTLLMMILVQGPNFIQMVMIVVPLLISAFLVMPVPYYHNVLQLILNIYNFIFVNQKSYRWKGWSTSEYDEESK